MNRKDGARPASVAAARSLRHRVPARLPESVRRRRPALSGAAARRADRACRDVLTFDRNHAHALHLLGLIAHQSGRLDAALDFIGRALALDRRNADCEFNMAQVLRALGRTEEAITHLTRATELRRDYAAAHLALADIHLQQGRFAEAAPRYQRALALQNASAESYSNFGVTLAGLGHWDGRRAVSPLALKPGLIDVAISPPTSRAGNITEALALSRRAWQCKTRSARIVRAMSSSCSLRHR
jgi:tetratricopeptide (TPR) repeat protein